jgi:hypothetical protein
MPNRAKLFIAAVLAMGLAAFVEAAAALPSVPSLRHALLYVAVTMLASVVKVRLPGLDGAYSLGAIPLLAGAVYFTLPETVMAAAAGVLIQSLVGAKRRPAPIQVVFNVANESASIAVACMVLSYLARQGMWPFRPALLAAAAAVYFVLNTGAVSGILALLGGGALSDINRQWFSRAFPYYLLGAGVVGVLPLDGRPLDFEGLAVLAPLAYLSHFLCGLAEHGRPGERDGAAGPNRIPASAKAFTATLAATALSFLGFALVGAGPIDWGWFLCYLALAAVTATWKVRLPGTTGTISVHYVVVLVALAQSGLLEALAIAAVGPFVQCLWRAKVRPQPVQIVFNIAVMMVATGVVFAACRMLAGDLLRESVVVFLGSAAVLHFITNTLLVAGVMALVERDRIVHLWRRVYFWSFPIYMVGAAAAAIMVATTRTAGWGASLLILPLMVMAQMTYRIHLAGNLSPAKVEKPAYEPA